LVIAVYDMLEACAESVFAAMFKIWFWLMFDVGWQLDVQFCVTPEAA